MGQRHGEDSEWEHQWQAAEHSSSVAHHVVVELLLAQLEPGLAGFQLALRRADVIRELLQHLQLFVRPILNTCAQI